MLKLYLKTKAFIEKHIQPNREETQFEVRKSKIPILPTKFTFKIYIVYISLNLAKFGPICENRRHDDM